MIRREIGKESERERGIEVELIKYHSVICHPNQIVELSSNMLAA